MKDFTNFKYLGDCCINFLKKINDIEFITENSSNVDWAFKGFNWLFDKTSVNGRECFNYQLASKLMTDAYLTASLDRNNHLKESLEIIGYEETFTIASSDLNVLFITKDSSVWAFWLSAQKLDKRASDFKTFLNNNHKTRNSPANKPEMLFGKWIASVDTKKRDEPSFIFTEDSWVFEYDDFNLTYDWGLTDNGDGKFILTLINPKRASNTNYEINFIKNDEFIFHRNNSNFIKYLRVSD